MKKTLFLLLLFLCSFILTLHSQIIQLPVEINSLKTKEIVSLKYGSGNKLVYFSEKGIATFREFSFKYDKKTGQLTECTINEDRGELVMNCKYQYTDAGYISETIRTSGKKIKEKTIEENNIYTDANGRLTKTVFDDGKLWEEFKYDENNNLVLYTQHAALGNGDVITTNTFNEDKSVFSHIKGLPSWFWGMHINSLRWCTDFIGNNNLKQSTTVDPRIDRTPVDVTYDYDENGYPVKQYYNEELVKEIKYDISIKIIM